MSASLKTIIGWLIDAKAAESNFLIVASEGSDELFGSPANFKDDPGGDYPVRVWAESSDDVHQKIHQTMVAGDKIAEVYDLRADLKAQLLVNRAYFVPRGTPSDGPLPPPPTVEQIISGKTATRQKTGVNKARATVKPRSTHSTTRSWQAPRPVDPEAAKTDLEAALEEGAGSLASRFRRGIKDGDDD